MQNLSTGTWASIGQDCPVRVSVSGSDLAHVVIGEDDQSVELIFNAEGLRKLSEASGKTVSEMDALSEQEDAAREATDHRASSNSEESST